MNPERQSSEPTDSGNSRFRSQRELEIEFNKIVKQLGYEPPENPEIEDQAEIERLLNVIADMGVLRTADWIAGAREANLGPYVPADPSEVRRFLYEEVSPNQPLRFNDLGSLDDEIVAEARLHQDHFREQLRELITYLEDPHITEISILDFPKLRAEIDEIEREAWKKILVTRLLQVHGISAFFDKNDPKAWNKLIGLTDEIASTLFRDYSRQLRHQAINRRQTPIRDVIDNIDEWRDIRQQAFEIAKDNYKVGPVELERMFEDMAPYLKPLVRGYINDLQAYADDESSSQA